jgi:hypothetical protein
LLWSVAPDPLFADDAITRLHKASLGLPRAFNNAATAALIAATTAGKTLVDDDLRQEGGRWPSLRTTEPGTPRSSDITSTTRMISVNVLVIDACQPFPARAGVHLHPFFTTHRQADNHDRPGQYRRGGPRPQPTPCRDRQHAESSSPSGAERWPKNPAANMIDPAAHAARLIDVGSRESVT